MKRDILEQTWFAPTLLGLVACAYAVANVAYHDWGAGLVTPYDRSDAAYYLHYAWLKAFVAPNGGELKDIIPPSPYTLLLVLAYKLLGPGLATPYLLNAFLLATTVFFITGFTQNLFDRRAGVAAGLICCFCGPLVFYAGITMKVAAVAALTTGALYFLQRYASGRRLRDLSLFTCFLTLVALERNNFLLFMPALLIPAVWPRERLKTTTARTGLILISILATSFIIGKPFADAHPTSRLGLNVYIGNSQIASGAYSVVRGIENDLVGHHTDMYERAEEQAGRPLTAFEADLWWIQRTLDDIMDRPLKYLLLTGRKTLMMFSAYSPGVPNRYRLWRWHDPFLTAALFDYGLILALAVPGFWLAWRQRVDRRPWLQAHLAFIAIYAGTIIAFFVSERYRIPVMVALIPLAGFTAAGLTRRFHPGIAGTVVALYALSLTLNAANPSGVGWRPFTDEIRNELQIKRQQNTRVHREKIDAVRNDNPDAWRELSDHYQRLGLESDARVFFERYEKSRSRKGGER